MENYSAKYRYIKRVVLRNFKSVIDQEVHLAPLTILVGENSSGKSSIFQAIRLLEQANNAKQKDGHFPLNGDQIQAGNIDDILSTNAHRKETISVGLDLSIPARDIEEVYENQYDATYDRYDNLRTDARDDILMCYFNLMDWLEKRKIDSYIVKWQVDIKGDSIDNPASANIGSLRLGMWDSNDKDQYQLLNVGLVGEDAKIDSLYQVSDSEIFHTYPATKEMKGITYYEYPFKGKDDLGSTCAVDLSGALPFRFMIKNDISYIIAFELINELAFLSRITIPLLGTIGYLSKYLENKMPTAKDEGTSTSSEIIKAKFESIVKHSLTDLNEHFSEIDERILDSIVEGEYEATQLKGTLKRLFKAIKNCSCLIFENGCEVARLIQYLKSLTNKEKLLIYATKLVKGSAQSIEKTQRERGSDFKFPESIYDLPELINFACQNNISNDPSKQESIAIIIATHLDNEDKTFLINGGKTFYHWREERTNILFGSVHYLEHFLANNNIQYLGPLRETPQKTVSNLPTFKSSYIGQSGEFISSVLNRLGPKVVTVPMPNGEQSSVSLMNALEAWGSRLGLLQAIRVVQEPKLGNTITVKTEGLDKDVTLDAVGVGVSQLLPVLVLCLLSEPGSVILLEQPELHLHPALQQRLADFLIAIARSGRQLIVETHSEYMVSRLRRRIAEDPDDDLLGISKVIFAERDRQTGVTAYQDVELSPYGDIDEWPKGFFDQAAGEEREIIRGGLKKRSHEEL